jgi:hypothetical protein
MFITVALVDMREMRKRFYVIRMYGPEPIKQVPSQLLTQLASRHDHVGPDMRTTMNRLVRELRDEALRLELEGVHGLDLD